MQTNSRSPYKNPSSTKSNPGQNKSSLENPLIYSNTHNTLGINDRCVTYTKDAKSTDTKFEIFLRIYRILRSTTTGE